MNNRCLILLWGGLCWQVMTSMLIAQHAYEASWQAGLLGVRQNPAAIATASFRGEVMLAGGSLMAHNTLFGTNEWGQFLPSILLSDLTAPLDQRRFLTNVQQSNPIPQSQQLWNATQQHSFWGPGAAWRIKTNPDLVERGLQKQVFSLRLERQEQMYIQGVNEELAVAFARGFAPDSTEAQSFTDDSFRLRSQSWDALAINYGLTLNKGRSLLHIVAGVKLLSVESFADVEVHGLTWRIDPSGTWGIQADSLRWAYNPSFARAVSPDANALRRYHAFENSWGINGELGIIYQLLDYERKPRLEIGASLQDVGAVQFWNLTHRRHRLSNDQVEQSLFMNTATGVNQAEMVLEALAIQTDSLADGFWEHTPYRVTAHAKLRLRRRWGLQLRGEWRAPDQVRPTHTWMRGTLSYEGQKIGVFLPVMLYPESAWHSEWATQAGILLSWKEAIMLGSNDLLSNLLASSLRQGVSGTDLFVALRIPVGRN